MDFTPEHVGTAAGSALVVLFGSGVLRKLRGRHHGAGTTTTNPGQVGKNQSTDGKDCSSHQRETSEIKARVASLEKNEERRHDSDRQLFDLVRALSSEVSENTADIRVLLDRDRRQKE